MESGCHRVEEKKERKERKGSELKWELKQVRRIVYNTRHFIRWNHCRHPLLPPSSSSSYLPLIHSFSKTSSPFIMTSRANRKRIQPTLDQVMSNIDSVPLASKIRASFNRVYDPNEQRYSFNNVSFWTKSLLEYFISRPDLDIGHLQQQYGIGRRSPVYVFPILGLPIK